MNIHNRGEFFFVTTNTNGYNLLGRSNTIFFVQKSLLVIYYLPTCGLVVFRTIVSTSRRSSFFALPAITCKAPATRRIVKRSGICTRLRSYGGRSVVYVDLSLRQDQLNTTMWTQHKPWYLFEGMMLSWLQKKCSCFTQAHFNWVSVLSTESTMCRLCASFCFAFTACAPCTPAWCLFNKT